MPAPSHAYFLLIISVIAGSQAANLIRLGDAHPIAIATWRLFLAGIMLTPFAAPQLAVYRRLRPAQIGWTVLAAGAMATHLFFWVAAVQHTTVANAAMAFSVHPVITAAAGFLLFSERISKKLSASIALGLLGVAAIGRTDLDLQPGHLVGDGLAALSAVLFSAYVIIGKKLRAALPIAAYVVALYLIASLIGLTVMLALGIPLFEYSGRTWLCFISLAVIPTVIGHGSLNYVLKYLNVSRVSTALLTEPLLAGTVAYFAWNESMTPGALIGYALICLSGVVLSLDQWTAPATNAER